MRTLREIEDEMKELRSLKDLAYFDYMDNSGDRETGPRLWAEFDGLRRKWNALVVERKTALDLVKVKSWNDGGEMR